MDEKTGEVILKVTNTSSENTTAEISIKGKSISTGKLIRLSAKNGKEENTIDNPTNVHPTETFITTSTDGAVVEIPANSLNIFRLK